MNQTYKKLGIRPFKKAAGYMLGNREVPHSIIHFVSQKCNCSCLHCFVYSDPPDPRYKGKELTLSDIEKLTKGFKKRLGVVSLTGGEPLMRKDILEIARFYVFNAGVHTVELATNACLTEELDKFVSGFLKTTDAGLYIGISFDGLKEEHDNARRVKGAFDKAAKATKDLLLLKEPRLIIGAAVTVFDQSTEELERLFYFLLNDLKTDAVTLAALRGRPKDSGAVGFNFEGYKKVNELIKKHITSRRLRPFRHLVGDDLINAQRVFVGDFVTQILDKKKHISPCKAGSAGAVIHANGSVYPCEILNRAMGNLKDFDMDIGRLLKSDRAKKTVRSIRTSRCFCTFECAVSYNAVFEPSNWRRLSLNYLKIKAGKAKHLAKTLLKPVH